ncbi:MAG: hypothetical protein HC896_01110 [Bacteroidales bacterium]|nr:hypothetical protein [Bacteroidales bacterium]
MAGEFDLDVQLNKNGKLHLKAYNKYNEYSFYETKYTQGVGLQFREEFDYVPRFNKKVLYVVGPKRQTINTLCMPLHFLRNRYRRHKNDYFCMFVLHSLAFQ